MGEVHRAHDSRLGRDVAIKVLPTSLSSEPVSLARFEREAKAIGALNHPNIINVHDVGTHGGVTFVVMEPLDGETLRARLQGTAAHTTTPSTKTPKPGASGGTQPLPRQKALEIAHQIALGLAAAHARGIVHRDLKTENIRGSARRGAAARYLRGKCGVISRANSAHRSRRSTSILLLVPYSFAKSSVIGHHRRRRRIWPEAWDGGARAIRSSW